ncbi:phosphopantothenoylcysteine decarboxylase [Onthophagus taurus]|uniref:phosphopantothenoylcysteine decarboxylase n=1 Tax=Onthophagus taurus TaxID=166361 RepID=UPI000C207547|nr:phosphopantothenoylcysteine decarboxylase [Onthophagus taurus]
MVNLLIGCTGSVATIKLPLLITNLQEKFKDHIQIKVVVTEKAQHFYKNSDIPESVPILTDEDEWSMWKDRGDPVLHIDLGKWADLFVIAPLDANTLAKIANGICDNLLTCTVRAWEIGKPLILCPAMNTKMYNHPITEKQLDLLKSWGYHIIPVIEKMLICGDKGAGAMTEVDTIVNYVQSIINKNP